MLRPSKVLHSKQFSSKGAIITFSVRVFLQKSNSKWTPWTIFHWTATRSPWYFTSFEIQTCFPIPTVVRLIGQLWMQLFVFGRSWPIFCAQRRLKAVYLLNFGLAADSMWPCVWATDSMCGRASSSAQKYCCWWTFVVDDELFLLKINNLNVASKLIMYY